jgi:hypothetical protein
MKNARLFSVVTGCAALILGGAILGCGSSNNNPLPQVPQDTAALAGTCEDTCNTLVTCAELPDDAVQDNLTVCQDNCNAPTAADTSVRDCSIQCDTTLACDAYMDCLCNCGLDEVCDHTGACEDTCGKLVGCAGLPDDAVQDNLTVCQDNCNAPAAADTSVRDCSIQCDTTLACDAYMDCLCNCGLDEVCG